MKSHGLDQALAEAAFRKYACEMASKGSITILSYASFKKPLEMSFDSTPDSVLSL